MYVVRKVCTAGFRPAPPPFFLRTVMLDTLHTPLRCQVNAYNTPARIRPLNPPSVR